MATLTNEEFGSLLRKFAKSQSSCSWSKAAVQDALQAVETRLDNSKAVINSDIETAAPGVFNAAQKLSILAWATLNFAKREGSI